MAQNLSQLTEGVALQPYATLAKSQKGKQVTAVIQQALSAPNVFVFGELLEVPSVQALVGTDDGVYFELLKIFAYGTYVDYKKNPQLPKLTALQTKKLQQLTIVTLAATNKVISYSLLQAQLEIPGIRDIEDLIIDAIYTGIVQGKLDQKSQQFEAEFAMGRDLKPESIEAMISLLQNWSVQSDGLLKTIKENISHANIMDEQEKKHKEEFAKKVESVKSTIKIAMESEMLQAAEFGEGGGDFMGEHGRKGGRGKMKGHKDMAHLPGHNLPGHNLPGHNLPGGRDRFK